MKKKLTALFTALAITALGTNAVMAKETTKTVVLAVDKSVTGGGFILEPTLVTVPANASASTIITDTLKQNNIDCIGYTDDSGAVTYYTYVADNDAGAVIPDQITAAAREMEKESEWFKYTGTRTKEGYLGSGDYSTYGGWMFSVNNEFPSSGANETYPADGDVIRMQFSITGGSDLGSYGSITGVEYPNKDELIAKIAKLRSEKTPEESEADADYQNALLTAGKFSVPQSEVNAALKALDPVYKAYAAGEKAIYEKTPSFGSEWNVIALSRGEYDFRSGEYDDYYNTYYTSVENKLKENNGIIDSGWGESAADYARVIIALSAAGRDVSDVGGYNLLEKLADFDFAKGSYITSPVYTLIALDTNNYTVPAAENQTTREKLIDCITDSMVADSGWAYFGDTPDVDLTAMALQSLAPYYGSSEKVKAASDKAVEWLSLVQNAGAGFNGYDGESSCSAAQVLTALCALGIDPDTDERFIKNGITVPQSIGTYATVGGFKNKLTDAGADNFAAQQCCYALASYYRIKDGRNSLYDMSDAYKVEITSYDNGIIGIVSPDTDADIILKTGDSAKVYSEELNAGRNNISVNSGADEIYIWDSVTGLLPLCAKLSVTKN